MHSVIFFGSDQYSAIVLSHLLGDKNLQIVSVVTDLKNDGTPVEQIAKKHGLQVSYYPALPPKLAENTVGLCASFDHLVPSEIIQLFNGHLYNLHPSLLPQYRNVSPVQYAIAMGDQVAGITLFRISEGIDNGEIVAQASESIRSDDTTPALSTRLFELGDQLFRQFLQRSDLRKNKDPFFAKNLIFTQRLTRDSGQIEWPVLRKLIASEPVLSSETNNNLLKLRLTHNPKGTILHDLVRALAPWPTVWSLSDTKKGELRISVESVIPDLTIKLAGKPKAISWSDFEKYYLK